MSVQPCIRVPIVSQGFFLLGEVITLKSLKELT